MTAPRVLFYVQHLLGVGHLQRAAALARAMGRQGLEVTLVRGGFPAPQIDLSGLEVRQLPPLRAADRSFSHLVDENGRPLDDALRARRRDQLLAIARETRPRVVILEQFPFGRRQLKFELLPLLAAMAEARPRPLVVSSVRDILVAASPQKARDMADTALKLFDRVMVHGDPGLIPFEATFPHAGEISDRIVHTGYVLNPLGPPPDPPPGVAGEVLVSAGGGAVGRLLLERAMAARSLSKLGDRHWRFLVGAATAEADFKALSALAPTGTTVERARTDFRHLLAGAGLSISQCGYNTAAEILGSGVAAVMVPYAGGNETEQTTRAELLAGHGRIHMLSEASLRDDGHGPARLATVIEAAMANPPATMAGVDLNGAETAAHLVKGWATAKG